MKILKRKIILAIIIIFTASVFFIINEDVEDNKLKDETNQEFEEVIIKEENNQKFNFYYETEDCQLEGKLFVNEHLVGNVTKGWITLEKNLLKGKYPLKLKGNLPKCAKEEGVPFIIEWEVIIEEFEEYSFIAQNYTIRSPQDYETMQLFVSKEETSEIARGIKFKSNETEDKLDQTFKWVDAKLVYGEDIANFGVVDFWQRPSETINKGIGDCEDWSTLANSLVLNTVPEANCYNLLLPTHLSVGCFFNNRFVIFDQGLTKVGVTIGKDKMLEERRAKIRNFMNQYYEQYGLEREAKGVQGAFNDKEYIIFNTNNDYLDWILEKI